MADTRKFLKIMLDVFQKLCKISEIYRLRLYKDIQ